jgi:hypothetical protein
MLSDVYSEYSNLHYYAECRYAKCLGTGFKEVVLKVLTNTVIINPNLIASVPIKNFPQKILGNRGLKTTICIEQGESRDWAVVAL